MAEVSFGEWLRRQRKAAGLTQEQLASQIDYSVSALKKIEAEERRPSAQIVERLARIFNVPQNERTGFLRFARGDWRHAPAEAAKETPWRTLSASLPSNLPVPLTSFIGRERELLEVRRLLSNTRLLTLTGPGGAGKTRLALQVAEAILPSFRDGVWLAESAPLTDASYIPQTIAEIFGLRERPNMQMIDIVTDYLRTKELLLILDNCEHLIEGCAKVSAHLLQACQKIRIIASSRETLGITGETAYRVPSLSLPGQAQVSREAVKASESGRLFVERAAAANPGFHLTNENAADVAQICRRLDGVPLAIELAAARTRGFSVEEIASRLDDRFRLLSGGSRAALERHQTLRALIDWSYELLSAEERSLFRHLSVFAGGWTLGAAEAICPDLDVLSLLAQLVDKSLVMVDEQAGSTRYHFLETIRQYAGEKLLEAGESRQAHARHLDFFLKFAEAAESQLNGPRELERQSSLKNEHDNLSAAMDWAMKNAIIASLRLGTALHVFWSRQGYQTEGRRFLEEALERFHKLPQTEAEPAHQRIALHAKALNAFGRLGVATGDLAGAAKILEESIGLARQAAEKYTLAQALSSLGYTRAFLGDVEGSSHAAEEGLRLARGVGDKFLLGRALTNMAVIVAMTQKDSQAVRAYGEEGLQLLREAGARWDLAMALFGLGLSAARLGEYPGARSRFEACLSLFAELKDGDHVNSARSELAHLERQQGHLEQAKALYCATLPEWQKVGHRAAIAHELECLAIIAAGQQDDRRAAQLFGAAEILRESIAIPMTYMERMEYERQVNELRLRMDQVAFAGAWAEGRALSMQQAIALATENRLISA